MNNVQAIRQLEDLKKDRLSFIHNDELDKVFLEDIKAISLAIQALKKCPKIRDNSFKCRTCGKELKTWRSIQKRIWTSLRKKIFRRCLQKSTS